MTKWIKKLAASAAIAGALASGAVMASDTANADIYSNRAQLVCDAMDYSPTFSHINALYQHSGVGIGDFASALAYGVRDYCPEHYDLAEAWLESL